ncbi:MAG: nitroreductase family protein, partial [Verrucomicrobiota bacterium]|nr:nitroreductase family protein [Verrucomicrobiota bacterium]
MSTPRFVSLPSRPSRSDEELEQRATEFYTELNQRRTVRDFSSRPVPRAVIENCLRAAGTSPSGANLQPWYFVAVGDPARKEKIRRAAEEEEQEFYQHRAPAEWLAALAALGSDS